MDHGTRFEDREMISPEIYARHLATYIASPTKIESLTRREFGRAPPLRTIAAMRCCVEGAQREFARPIWVKDSEAKDGDDYVMPSLIRPAPKPRARDYIHIVRTTEPVEHENPFLMLYSVGSRVIASVARDFGIQPADILGRHRKSYLVDARAVVAMTLRRWGRKSYPEIGRIMGGRDHSTVVHAVNAFDIYCRRNELVRSSYERHLKLIEEAEQIHAAVAQDAEAEASDAS